MQPKHNQEWDKPANFKHLAPLIPFNNHTYKNTDIYITEGGSLSIQSRIRNFTQIN